MSEAFLVIDVQNDFCPGGALAVLEGDKIVQPIDEAMDNFDLIVLTQDWYPQGSMGTNFHPDLRDEKADVIIWKGSNPAVDSCSAFFENDKVTPTGLHRYLKDCKVTDLTLVGLATDFCVAFSALDAARLGYRVTVRFDMVNATDADGSLRSTMGKMSNVGVNLVNG